MNKYVLLVQGIISDVTHLRGGRMLHGLRVCVCVCVCGTTYIHTDTESARERERASEREKRQTDRQSARARESERRERERERERATEREREITVRSEALKDGLLERHVEEVAACAAEQHGWCLPGVVLLCIWYKEGEEVAQRGTHVVDGGVMR